MQKETIVYVRDVLGKNKPLKVTLDNQHIFYDRIPSSCPLMWDDENERLIILRTNQDAASQSNAPFETTVVDYEQIQQVACYDDWATVQDLDSLSLIEEKKNKFSEFIKEVGNKGTASRTYFSTKQQ